MKMEGLGGVSSNPVSFEYILLLLLGVRHGTKEGW